MASVAKIAVRVVVHELRYQFRAAWQTHRIDVPILIVPVLVEMLDPQQRPLRTVVQLRRHSNFFRERMGMREDRMDVDVDRQLELIDDAVIRLASRDIDVAAANSQHDRPHRGRPLGEMKANAKTNLFLLASRLQVRVQYEARVRFEQPGGALQPCMGSHPRGPGHELSIGVVPQAMPS